MSAIVLLEADDPDNIHIAQDTFGGNLVFEDWMEADNWIQKNARVGWCTRIIDFDE